VKVKIGATAATLPLLADGDWHPLSEVGQVIEQFIIDGTRPEEAASYITSQLRVERMGLRGREDQQVRLRPDLYFGDSQGHERLQMRAGADMVLRALLGLRSFQQLVARPGQQLNPAQRYWLDKALQITGQRIAEGGEDANALERST
jgi:hypothetical protein